MKNAIVLALSAGVMLASAPAGAAPDNKPVQAAQQFSGTGCIVRGSEDQPFQFDPECEFKITNKRDRDGQLQFQIYRDKGTLQPGQEINTAFNFREEFNIGPFECTQFETASPSGKTSSYRHCRRAD